MGNSSLATLQHLLSADIRHDWTTEEIRSIYHLPFNDLLFAAQTVHRQHFNANEIQTATLLSIKTGACPEDCAYCPQSGHYNTGLSKEQLMAIEEVLEKAKAAKDNGSSRFCMGAAWRSPREKDFRVVLEMVRGVKQLGLETCVTLGMLSEEQTQALKEAGLDYYNHNLDSSPEYYQKIITTRSYQQRLDTLERVRDAGINVCAGGIIGMGEEEIDRFGLLQQLANLPEHPQSVPINRLVAVEGTPLGEVEELDALEFVRMIATARILMPRSYVRLSAGRETMSDETQALCFAAGANSIFYGEKLLTTENPAADEDRQLFKKLGLKTSAEIVEEQALEKESRQLSEAVKPTSKPLFRNAAV